MELTIGELSLFQLAFAKRRLFGFIIWFKQDLHPLFLTPKAINTLIGPDSTFSDEIVVKVNGKYFLMGSSKNYFNTVNIIGMDFLMLTK